MYGHFCVKEPCIQVDLNIILLWTKMRFERGGVWFESRLLYRDRVLVN